MRDQNIIKRTGCILLAGLLCLNLTACAGRDTDPVPSPESSPITESTPTPEVPSVPEATPVPAESPAPEAFTFTRNNFPKLDGSTSTAPLAEAVCSLLLGEEADEISDLVQFNKTTNAYYNLLNGRAELLIVGEPNEGVLADKELLGFEWLQTPFATDAFVFVVNEDNPVDSITVDEAKRIYTGEITNWKELGGDDMEIIPFQRNADAGSQSIMEKLVMQGTPMMDAPTDYIVATMGQLMEAVKSYDGSPGAIGYSVYYYAEEMKMAQGLKLLALEGVEPNPETIRAEEYPLLNPKYVVIPADAAEDAPNRLLYNWLLSEDGQRLVAREGYVSIMDLDEPEASDREPLPEPIGSRWYENYTGELIPRDDYGPLIPYAGLRLMDDWPARSGCLFGLMTEDGVVVTDPVYSKVTAPSGYGDDGKAYAHPLLILRQGDPSSSAEYDPTVYAIAAADGSRCTPFEYRTVCSNGQGLILFKDDSITLMSPEGDIQKIWTVAEMGIEQSEFDEMLTMLSWGEGYIGYRRGNYMPLGWVPGSYTHLRVFDLVAGAISEMSTEEWDALAVFADHSIWTQEHAVPNSQPVTDSLLGPEAPYLLSCHEYADTGTIITYYRQDGTPLPQLTTNTAYWYQQVNLLGGLIEVLDLNIASYYDLETMECVFRTYLGYESD